MCDTENGWDDDGTEWDDSEVPASLGFEAILSRFLGYEVTVTGSSPIRLDIVRPSLPDSPAVIVGVHADCVVVQSEGRYTVYPQANVIVSIPTEEWETDEWDDVTE